MAKRKRLTPLPQGSTGSSAEVTGAPEAKSVFPSYRDGFVGHGAKAPRAAPPIADVAGDASAAAALDEMAETLRLAREGGRMVVDLALDAIDANYLVRDRLASDPVEMDALVNSLLARGQQTPVEVAPLHNGRHGLISGWRRLTALRRLHAETGDDRFATVQALIRRPAEAAEAYLAMVEENEIRVGLSYYERARIVAKAVEQSVYETEAQALRALFGNASRPRRSKIGSFLTLVHALDGYLIYPEAIGERLGLALSKALVADDSATDCLRQSLAGEKLETIEQEQALLATFLSNTGCRAPKVPADNLNQTGTSKFEQGSKTVTVKVAKDGSLVLHGRGVDANFRRRLEAWLAQSQV